MIFLNMLKYTLNTGCSKSFGHISIPHICLTINGSKMKVIPFQSIQFLLRIFFFFLFRFSNGVHSTRKGVLYARICKNLIMDTCSMCISQKKNLFFVEICEGNASHSKRHGWAKGLNNRSRSNHWQGNSATCLARTGLSAWCMSCD